MTSLKYCFTTPANLLRVEFVIRPMHRKFCFAKLIGSSGAKKTTLPMQHNFRVAMPKNPFGVAFAIRPIHHKFCFAKPMGCDKPKETALPMQHNTHSANPKNSNRAEGTAASMTFYSCFAAPFNITSLHLISISQYLFFMKIANILI